MEPPEGVPLAAVITELKRRLRLIAQESKTFGDTAQLQLRKQRTAIEKLTAENAALKDEVEQAREALSQEQNTLLGARMQALNEQCQGLLRDISAAKKEEQVLLESLSIMEGRVKKCRERMGSLGGVYAAEMSAEAIAKQTRILENRLDKALQKYSQATAHNRRLKEDINSLRKERVTFDNLYRKAESDLLAEKKAVMGLIKQASEAYKARDEAQRTIAALKTSEAKERRSFETEWTHMQQFLDSLQSRQGPQAQAKQLADLEVRRVADCEQDAHSRGDPWESAEEVPATLYDPSKIKCYQAAFAKIQAATGISSVDELIEAFRIAEEHNFSLFSYVNSLSAEVESHEAAIHKLREDLQSRTDSQKALFRRKASESKELHGQSVAVEGRVKTLEKANAGALELLREVMQSTKRMFDLVGGGARYSDALWAREEVAEVNITNYLQAVEEAVDEMVARLLDEEPGSAASPATDAAPPNKKKAAKKAEQGKGGRPAAQIKLPSAVNRTSSFDVLDEEEAESRPFSREELLQKLQRGMAKRDEGERARHKKSVAR